MSNFDKDATDFLKLFYAQIVDLCLCFTKWLKNPEHWTDSDDSKKNVFKEFPENPIGRRVKITHTI